jgi:hypothetical protein
VLGAEGDLARAEFEVRQMRRLIFPKAHTYIDSIIRKYGSR